MFFKKWFVTVKIVFFKVKTYFWGEMIKNNFLNHIFRGFGIYKQFADNNYDWYLHAF